MDWWPLCISPTIGDEGYASLTSFVSLMSPQDCLAPKPPDSDKLQKEPMKGDAASRSHEKPPPAAPKVAFMSAGPETEVGGAGNDSGDCKEIIQMSSFTR